MEIFGSGGGQTRRRRRSPGRSAPTVPLLGQVPIDTALREGGDEGMPIVLSEPDSPAAVVLRAIAEELGGKPRGLAGMQLSLTPTSGRS